MRVERLSPKCFFDLSNESRVPFQVAFVPWNGQGKKGVWSKLGTFNTRQEIFDLIIATLCI